MANPKSTAAETTRSATAEETASEDAAPDSGQTVAQEDVSPPVRVEFFQSGESAFGYRICDRLGNALTTVDDVGTTEKEAFQAARRDERAEGLVLHDGLSEPVTLNAW